MDFGGTLYTTKVHFFENVNFSVASLMTILGESTMKQSGNMFLEIKNQERRNKGTSWTFYCHPMNYPSDVDASWEGDTQRILQHGRYLESRNSQALNHIQENPAQPIRSIRFASMEFRNFQESLKFQNRIESNIFGEKSGAIFKIHSKLWFLHENESWLGISRKISKTKRVTNCK